MLATIIQLVGLGLITTGVMLFSVPLGLIVAGTSALLVGLALERTK
jgi:hypothetical protein